MQVKLLTLIEAQPALEALGNTKLPVKAAYRLGKALDHIRSALNDLEDRRVNTLKAVGTFDPAKNVYLFETPEIEAKWRADFKEEQNKMVEIEMPRVTLEDLGDAKVEPSIFVLIAKLGIIADIKVVKDEQTT